MSHRALLLAGLLAALLVGSCLLALRAFLSDPEGRQAGGRPPPAGKPLRPAPRLPAAPVPDAVAAPGGADGGADGGSGGGSTAPPGGGPAAGSAESAVSLPAGEAALVVLVVRSGLPVAGAQIEVRREAEAATATTGRDGSAEFANLAAGSYQVRALTPPPSSLGWKTSIPLALSGGERLEVRCEVSGESGEITGRVLDTDRQPLSGIEVEARTLTAPGSAPAFVPEDSPVVAVSGADGLFHLEGVPLLEHVLSTRGTLGYSSAQATIHPSRSEPVEIIVGIRKTLVIRGTVRDHRGSPVNRALVSSPLNSGPPAESGADGGYLLEVSYERGALGLSAAKDGYAAAERLLPESEVEDREEVEADLLLEPKGAAGGMNGRVLSAADGKPAPGQVVLLHSSSLNATYQVRSDEDGSYGISEVRPAGDYRVWVNPERSYRDYQLFPVAIAAEILSIDIALEPLETCRIRGRLVDPEGVPVPWLTLWIRSQAASGNSVSIAGDGEGRFSSVEVPAGELVIESRASPWIGVRGVQVEPGREEVVEITVGLGKGSLSGYVTDALSRPVARARLALTWSGTGGASLRSTVYRETVSDSQGYFHFTGLARGQASVHAAAPNFSDRSIRHDLTGGDEDLQIVLTPAGD